MEDAAGNLYGTTISGGDTGVGTVFRVDRTGTETVLHSFTDTDGRYPAAGLVLDNVGNLYGTTSEGGDFRVGTVFKLDTSGTETVLYSFNGSAGEGHAPGGGLLRDSAGNLYGTTLSGGDFSLGTVFRLDTNGVETVLHSFAGEPSDGKNPVNTSLLMDTTGNLYGITAQGGTSDYGVVYRLSRRGTFTVIHSFAGGTADGCYPYGTPVTDGLGNLYGSTRECGAVENSGTVWKVSKNGTETVLYNFTDTPSDGRHPESGVIFDPKGHLYGATEEGGAFNFGTVYSLNKEGITVLHSFDVSDGQSPMADLIRDSKSLYGTTWIGGGVCCGTVWKLTK